MANGIDDEPSGAQAYFTTAPPRDQQQSRPEDDQIAGNDREGLFSIKSYGYLNHNFKSAYGTPVDKPMMDVSEFVVCYIQTVR